MCFILIKLFFFNFISINRLPTRRTRKWNRFRRPAEIVYAFSFSIDQFSIIVFQKTIKALYRLYSLPTGPHERYTPHVVPCRVLYCNNNKNRLGFYPRLVWGFWFFVFWSPPIDYSHYARLLARRRVNR